ncbi:Membrane protein involved in the export of O-antigen and teichoic acid [Arthrobacter sp. ov407]|uniref:lipopolysaccharide biosynthesis protein n=1 Tax=Arthrobacter sp. ov407 TaxID=1761748 RepID=UPI0008847729|nr:oligosaccharide flippase family protein [Arthrobacter sp. ov407]SDL13790.1 Membrane protein involved in the export of O-antigen and teichoic acid [Arthrobacter sp. ov407]
MGGAALAKIVVMGSSGLLAVLTSRLIIAQFGTEAYAQYGLLASFPSLLPFADLGIAAVVINAVAGSKEVRRDEEVGRTLVTAVRILSVSGLTIIALAGLVTLLDGWPTLLGNGLAVPEGSTAAFICLGIFGAFMPLVVGQRILVGLGRTTSQVAAQAVVAPFMLLSVLAVSALSLPAGNFLAVFSFLGNSLVSAVCLVLASRHVRPQLGLAFRRVLKPRVYPGVPAFGLAWPVIIQMTALPIAMQTDRLLLSHLTTGDELAQYNLASQLFGLVLQTIAAAGVALWPIYARARAEGRVESPALPTVWFVIGGLCLAGGLAALSPWLAAFISEGQIALDPWLVAGFVLFVTLQAAKYPIGMYMTDQRGLWFQVVPILILVPLNLGISWFLIGLLGAGGPVIGSAISVALCQVIPNFWYVRRDLKRQRQPSETQLEGVNK